MNYLTFYRKSNYLKLTTIALLSISISMISCGKDDDEVVPTVPVVPTPPPAPENPIVSFIDGNATLTAIQSRTFQKIPFIGGFTAIDLGLAAGVFYDNPTSGTFIEAGTVECNSEQLKMNTNNSYVYTPGLTNTTGIDFSTGEANWEIGGSTAGGNVPALSLSNSSLFPDINKISSETTIDKTMDYALATDKAWYSDSLIYMVGGIYHVVGAGVLSYTFTAAELATLKAGPNYAQITGYNIVSQVVNGNTYHLVNETVVTESVTIK